MNATVDVAVLGSGICALLVARELSKTRACSIAVVDESPFGAAASTRNQGWLHSGSLLTGMATAPYCEQLRRGQDYYRDHFRDAVSPSGALFLLKKRERRDLIACQSELYGFSTRFHSMAAIAQESSLFRAGRRHIGAVEVDDSCIDTGRVLHRILEELEWAKVSLIRQGPSSINALAYDRSYARWKIDFGENPTLLARHIVVAYGIHTGLFLSRFHCDFKMSRADIPVLYLNMALTDQVIADPYDTPFAFSVVPCRDAAGVPGITMLIDQSVKIDPNARIHFDVVSWVKKLSLHAQNSIPGLFARSFTCKGVLHLCHKPRIRPKGFLVEEVPMHSGKVYVVASEFFTLAPLAAIECASRVLVADTMTSRKEDAPPLGGLCPPTLSRPTVAPQPYRSPGPMTERWDCHVHIDAQEINVAI